MAIQPVVEAPPASLTPSVTCLQLLGNLSMIRDNLEQLGKMDVVVRLDRYIDHLQAGCADDVEFIDYATAAIHWVYRVLDGEERAVVFRGCVGAGCAYVPKAEVEFFCRQVEPRILEVGGEERRALASVYTST